MLITYKDVILYELTIVISTMVTEALPIDIGGHAHGKGIPGFLWPLSLVCVRSSLQPPSGMPSVLCLLHTQAISIPTVPLLILWAIPLKFSPAFDSGCCMIQNLLFIVCLFYCLTS